MQALAERLDALTAGKVFSGFDALSFSSLKTVVPGPDAFVGRAVERVTRRGKHVIFEVGDAGRVVLHLSQAGRVDIEDPPKRTKPRAQGGVVAPRTGRRRSARRARSGARLRGARGAHTRGRRQAAHPHVVA
jgi:formamidopyrimidine-DNA glycosylase